MVTLTLNHLATENIDNFLSDGEDTIKITFVDTVHKKFGNEEHDIELYIGSAYEIINLYRTFAKNRTHYPTSTQMQPFKVTSVYGLLIDITEGVRQHCNMSIVDKEYMTNKLNALIKKEKEKMRASSTTVIEEKAELVVTDRFGHEYVFVGNKDTIDELKYSDVSLGIELVDELGIFSVPKLQGSFTPNEDNDFYRNSPYTGLELEFVDSNDIPYFCCDNINVELYFKDNYDWAKNVQNILSAKKQLVNILGDVCNTTKTTQLGRAINDLDNQLEDMGYFERNLHEMSSPFIILRHVCSEEDMEQALEEVYKDYSYEELYR